MNKVKRKKTVGKIIFFIIAIFIGFYLGILAAKSGNDNIISNTFLGNIFNIVLMLIMIMLGFLFHIIVHEGGHLIFGLLTGYTFVSFRIGSFIIVKENEKFKLKRYNIPGTGGQCLMMPPDLKEGKFHFVIYNFGGAIMNLIVSIIGILILVYIDGIGYPFNEILMLSGFAGIILALTNAIPLKIGGIANDGHNAMSMLKDEEAKRGFYIQLRVNGLQHQGVRIKDLPLEMFKLKEGADITSPLNTSIRLMEYSWHLDNMDLESAKLTIDSFIPYINKLIPIYKHEINCERIFLELLGDCNKEFIDNLYNKELKKYIKQAKFMINKKRLLIAYEGFYNEDKLKALKLYEEFKKIAAKSPNKSDADSEMMIADLVIERL